MLIRQPLDPLGAVRAPARRMNILASVHPARGGKSQ